MSFTTVVKKSLLLLIVLCFSTANLSAQQGSFGKHRHDFRNFNLGFMLGFNYSSYNVKGQINVKGNNSLLRRVELVDGPGIGIGMITNYNLKDNLSIRFIPTVSLELRKFNYYFEGAGGKDSLAVREVNSAYGHLPLFFQYKTRLYKRYRFYVLGGVQFSVTPSSNKDVVDDPNLFKTASTDLAVVVGFGFTLYGDRLKLSPEIRLAIGMNDIYVRENTNFATAISRLTSQLLSFNINFE